MVNSLALSESVKTVLWSPPSLRNTQRLFSTDSLRVMPVGSRASSAAITFGSLGVGLAIIMFSFEHS